MAVNINGYNISVLPSKIEGPNLVYPNGGEIFSTREIEITWEEPFAADNLIWIEIFFTGSYSRNGIQEWRKIASIPSGSLIYTWEIPPSVKSDGCRVSIRAINYKGDISDSSISADNFRIESIQLSKPAVIEPISGNSYYSYMPIILDKNGVLGRYSQRVYYNIYYSSESQGIDWTLLKSYVSVESGPIYWDLRDINKASDYILRIELCDDENISEPVFIENITISGLNYFLIDTVAPKGTVKVLNNREYTRDRGIALKLSAYDSTTEVSEFKIEQLELSGTTPSDVSVVGPYEKMTDISTWQIRGNDGLKLIQARFKDFAGNILEDTENAFFRTYKSLNNEVVNAFLIDGDDYWMAFGGDVPSLYLNQELISTLVGEATSMCIYDDTFYMGVKTSINTGILYKYVAGVFTKVIEMTSLTTDASRKADCIINSMAVFDDNLFLGLQNGLLYYYNGANILLYNSNETNPKSIYKLSSNSSNLFIFLDNSETFKIMYKNMVYDTYEVSTVEI